MFQEEVDVLVQTAESLGKFSRHGNRNDFVTTLVSLGLPLIESELYWDALDISANGVNGKSWRDATNNTETAMRLGLLLKSEMMPRNLLLYRLMQRQFPDILEVRVSGTRHIGGMAGNLDPEARRVTFKKTPRDAKGFMAIHRVLKGEQPQAFKPAVLIAARRLSACLGEEIGLNLADVLFSNKILIPQFKMAALLGRVLTAGQCGKEIILAGAFCPDYAYEITDNPQIPYRYTFDSLGNGVGLVARQFARIVPALSEFLRSFHIPHRFVLGIGDFEADSEDVLRGVGLNREEFIERCRQSLEAFRKDADPQLPLKLELFSTERGGERFRRYATEATAKMNSGVFGKMPELYDDLSGCIAEIPHQYGAFYRRWYGDGLTDQDVRKIVFAQGGEYAAIARIYKEDFGDNVVILAGDRPEMHRFNAFFQLQPTLCAKRAY